MKQVTRNSYSSNISRCSDSARLPVEVSHQSWKTPIQT